MKKTVLVSMMLFCFSCKTVQTDPKQVSAHRGTIAEHAMVVSAREEASRIGVQIMEKGGNAFDAMVATKMALAVCYPFAGNLGGGGFMVYRDRNGNTGALDFREKAPAESTEDMYLDSLGRVVPEKSRIGGLAVGVPGSVAGIFAVHEKFGTLPMNEILAPVISLAKEGFVVTKNQEETLKRYRKQLIQVNQDTIVFAQNISAGDTIRNLPLAETLQRIVAHGPDEFYRGRTAAILIDFLKENGGIISSEDLEQYEAVWRKPVVFEYGDYQISSMPPPSSGGIVLGQILKMVEPFPLEKLGHNSLEMIQVLTEAERRAYADRSFYLGDPDFVEIPTKFLTSEEYLHTRMQSFTFDRATPSKSLSYGKVPGYESMETTHFSIVDPFGNAVAVTTTLNGAYGSKLYIEELGFFLNNEMDDFSAKPGVPNMFGLIGAEANAIAPGKRMLSSMTPTIVEKDGAFFMALGSPGGSKIITSVLQAFLNVVEFDMSMQQAVDAPRFHHQWLPDEIVFEPGAFDQQLLEKLRQKGYRVDERQSRVLGKVDAVLRLENGWFEGGADRRGDDTAVGF